MDGSILQEIRIIFQSNLSNQIQRWYQLLSKMISEYQPTRNILVICHPYAGSKYGRHVYNTKIKPMFERAQHNVSYFEINELCSVDEVLNDYQGDFDSLYGLVIIGGDGSVINVINGLLRYLARENRTRLDTENDLPTLPFPICIVPTGTTNIICHSIHGNTDQCTPILHLLFNEHIKIDMSAIFDVNRNFVTANFGAGAGYAGNALKYFSRYSSYSPKKIVQKSFAKAASNKNLKPIEMEIRYIPVEQNNTNDIRCYSGCPRCTPSITERTDDQVKIFNDTHVHKLNQRTNPFVSTGSNNNRSSSPTKQVCHQQREGDKRWKILRHHYLHVAVLTNANLWSLAPQGLSKCGHLADGLLDLILIEQTARRDFLRFVRRNGNSKNPYEFSFTSLIKVKEIEIKLKFFETNVANGILNTNYQLNSTLSTDSSQEEQCVSKDMRHQLNEQPETLSERLSLSDDRNSHDKHAKSDFDSAQIDLSSSNVHCRRKNLFQALKIKKDKLSPSRSSSACDRQRTNKKQYQQSNGTTLRPAKSFLNLLMSGSASNLEKHQPSSIVKQDFPLPATNERRSSIVSRLSCVEYRKRSISAKDQRRNKKQSCMWNLDFTPYNSPLIRIKCFHRFLPVFGVGPYPDTTIKEVNYSCFGRMP